MSFQNRNFNTQQSGGTKVNWFASSIRQLPIDPFIDGKVTDGSILYWSKPNQYWTALDKNVKRLTCYGQYLIWDGTTWIIVGDQNVRLGCESGKFNQGSNAVAIGNNAGYYNQGENGIAIGYQAGYTGQASETISIGSEAGSSNQGNNSIGIGLRGGFLNQGSNSVALGNCSGETKQGNFAISVGFGAGASAQNDNAIAIGRFAGLQSQSVDAISIGRLSGFSFQKEKAIAIGYQAGYRNQGSNSIAIGPDAGYTGQHPNTIIINASGSALNSITEQSCYATPIRYINYSQQYQSIVYDETNKEIIRTNPQGVVLGFNLTTDLTLTTSYQSLIFDVLFTSTFGFTTLINKSKYSANHQGQFLLNACFDILGNNDPQNTFEFRVNRLVPSNIIQNTLNNGIYNNISITTIVTLINDEPFEFQVKKINESLDGNVIIKNCTLTFTRISSL